MNNTGRTIASFLAGFLLGFFGVFGVIIYIIKEKDNLRVQNCLIASLIGLFLWYNLFYKYRYSLYRF